MSPIGFGQSWFAAGTIGMMGGRGAFGPGNLLAGLFQMLGGLFMGMMFSPQGGAFSPCRTPNFGGPGQAILAAVRSEQVSQALESSLARAVPHQMGVLLLGEELRAVHQWGGREPFRSALLNLAELVQREQRPLYLPDLLASRIQSPAAGICSIIACPLPGEAGQLLGVLVVGAKKQHAFNNEQHDFVCTCACLAAAGLHSLGLFSRLESAHQQVVQAGKPSAIGRLAATVAHELNTPLAAIGLALEAVALRPEKAGEKLGKASNALERAQEIVRGLLHHARQSGPSAC